MTNSWAQMIGASYRNRLVVPLTIDSWTARSKRLSTYLFELYYPVAAINSSTCWYVSLSTAMNSVVSASKSHLFGCLFHTDAQSISINRSRRIEIIKLLQKCLKYKHALQTCNSLRFALSQVGHINETRNTHASGLNRNWWPKRMHIISECMLSMRWENATFEINK